MAIYDTRGETVRWMKMNVGMIHNSFLIEPSIILYTSTISTIFKAIDREKNASKLNIHKPVVTLTECNKIQDDNHSPICGEKKNAQCI